MTTQSEQPNYLCGFYKAPYVFKVGTPHIFTCVARASGSRFIATSFVIIKKSGGEFILKTRKADYNLARDLWNEVNIGPAFDFVSENAFRFGEESINEEQWKIYEETKNETAIRPVEFVKLENWKDELKRLRYQGLPTIIIQTMINHIGADLGTFIFGLSSIDPIKVIDVK